MPQPIAIILGLFLGASSCVSLKTVSLTQIPKKRSKPVSAKVEKWVFLGFNFDNDFVDQIEQKLTLKCQKKQVRGVLTKYETTSYLIVFKHTVQAKGFCG